MKEEQNEIRDNMKNISNLYVHSDFDGLISAHLLKKLYPDIKEIIWAKPQEMKGMDYDVTCNDIVADLPMPSNKMFHKWYDHHPCNNPRETSADIYWDQTAKSCARVIFHQHRMEFAKRYIEEFSTLMELADAADKIDSADFDDFNNPGPAGIISVTLVTNNKQRDNTYKHYLLELLEQGKTLKEISQTQPVKTAYEERMKKISEEYKQIKIKYVTKYGINFAIITEKERFVSKAATFKVFSEKPETHYFIKIRHKRGDIENASVGIGANVYKKGQNNIRLDKITRQKGGGGARPDMGSYPVKKEDVQKAVKELITQIATLKKMNEEDTV